MLRTFVVAASYVRIADYRTTCQWINSYRGSKVKKIPTIFVRDMTKQPALVTPEWHPDCLWVRDGEGAATLKHDGTCCLVRHATLYRRRELRPGDVAPANFESTGTDDVTGKTVGWVPVGDSSEDKWHREAWGDTGTTLPDGTYELMGPKVQGNKGGFQKHVLVAHGAQLFEHTPPRDFDGLRVWLDQHTVEGIVWHHEDGRMAKIKRRDFGFKW